MQEGNILEEKEVIMSVTKTELIEIPSNIKLDSDNISISPAPREIIINVPRVEKIESGPKDKKSIEKNKIKEDKIIDLTKSDNKPLEIKQKDNVKDIQLTKLDVLKKISSGTGLREGLDNIVKGGMGALILIDNLNANNVFQDGFKINCKFTSKRLFELAKMDGSIVLSNDFRKILFANTFLTPNRNLSTLETGTRHQAAERSAKQINGLVIAVSERRGTITLYYGGSKYVLQDTEELLRRATETMQIVEKQREVFDELITNLNILELNNMVSVEDVCAILERLEMIRKMSHIINEYILELGKDGMILRMRMREITKGIDKTQDLIIKDYVSKPLRVRQFFDSLSFDGLLDLENMAKVLLNKALDAGLIPKGHRILSKTHLSKDEIDGLIKHFKNLEGIFSANKDNIRKIIKDNPEKLQKELNNLRDHIVVGKNI